MVWIAAGMPDAQIGRKVMLQIHAVRDRPLADLIKDGSAQETGKLIIWRGF
jgi:hypothetical protein